MIDKNKIIYIAVDIKKNNNYIELDLSKAKLDGLQILEIVYNDIEKLKKSAVIENEKAVVVALIQNVKKYNKIKDFLEFVDESNKQKYSKLEKNIFDDRYKDKLVNRISYDWSKIK